MGKYHISVLLQEAIEALHIGKGKKYIDATLGAGGHSLEICRKGGIVLGIDQDSDAREEAAENLKGYPVTIVAGNFANIKTLAKENHFDNVAGIIFDIGVSSHQLDSNKRGFSFQSAGPLDMRMDTNLSVTAADLVNGLTKGELIELFTKYGEETRSKKIAEAIVNARLKKPIQTTTELADIILRIVPKTGKIHPGTKVFQSLRIAVNDELNALESGIRGSASLLDTRGRLVVITFHSLEDRIVKNLFDEFETEKMGKIVTKKPVMPTEEEVVQNRRARSAKMRIFEKL